MDISVRRFVPSSRSLLGTSSSVARSVGLTAHGIRRTPIYSHFIELAPQLANFGALASDLFTEQSRREENASEDQTRRDDRPYRSVADAIEQQESQRDEAGDGADGEK